MKLDMYIPDIIQRKDLAMFEKARMGRRYIPGETPALIIIDMTHGFVEDEYLSGYSKTGFPAAEAIKQLLDLARTKNILTFFTRGYSKKNPLERGVKDEKKDYIEQNEPDLMYVEKAHRIIPLLAPIDSEIVITKPKPSAFFGTQLISMLAYKKIDTLIITGMVTSGCIRATVMDAYSYNYKVLIPIECVADRCEISHQVSLFDMDQKWANVISLTEVVKYIKSVD